MTYLPLLQTYVFWQLVVFCVLLLTFGFLFIVNRRTICILEFLNNMILCEQYDMTLQYILPSQYNRTSFIGPYLWTQCPSFLPLNIEIQTKEETSQE